MRTIRVIPCLLLLATIAGCGQVMSPYLMMPSEPLMQNQVQFMGSAAQLPSLGEVSPGASFGAVGLARYGVTDRFSIQGEMWTNDITRFSNTGFSLESVSLLNDRSSKFCLGFVPRIAIMNSGVQLEGWALSASLIGWHPKVLDLVPFFGVGAVAGAADLHYSTPGYAFGFGGIANLGLSYNLAPGVTVDAECAAPLIYDTHNRQYVGWFVGAVSMGYKF